MSFSLAHPAPLGGRRIHRRGRQGTTRRITSWFSAIALSTLSASAALAATVIRVDNTHPNASPNGPGTVLAPYSSIMAALNANRDPGTWVLVRPGTYRERVSVPASGSANQPIVIRAEGEVIVDGADDFATSELWTHVVDGVWMAPTVDWEPFQVFADGERLQPSSQVSPTAVEPGRFRWFMGEGLAVNLGGNPASYGVAVGRRSHGFLVSNRNHVLIEGFEVRHAERKGVELLACSSVVVRRNHVHASGFGGIEVQGGAHVQVFANQVHDNNNHGILFRLGVTNSVIDANESFENVRLGLDGATGIYLSESSNNRVEGNLLHHNQDSGCEIQSGSNDNLVVQNVAWSNGDHGFAHLYAQRTLLLNNVAWGNHTEGFSVEGGATGTRIYNSISVNRALDPESYCMFVDSSSTAGFDADFNIYWNIADQPPVRFGQVIYPNVAAFQAGTGMEMNSFGADPRFVNAFAGDFHLRSDSPAIDAAATGITGWEETDVEGRMRSDEPTVPNTGTGPLGFADRGAYEYFSATLSVQVPAGPSGLALASAFPNPSRRGVAFTVEQSTAGEVSWTVFDIQGREQWGAKSTLPGGRSQLAWPLTNRAGARVPSGVYLVRVQRGTETATARFTVM
jgi:parallel beta-helix repeat protein